MKKSILALAAAVFCAAAPVHADSAKIMGTLGSQMNVGSTEAQLRYIGTPMFWNLQPVVGVSMARNGSGWVGAGAALTWRPGNDSLFVRWTSMVGVHKRGSGRNLGGPVQFRNALDFGLTTAKGMEYGIGVDHRSSANIYRPNPGLNTAYIFASFPLN